MDLLTGGLYSRRSSDGKSTSPLPDDVLPVCILVRLSLTKLEFFEYTPVTHYHIHIHKREAKVQFKDCNNTVNKHLPQDSVNG